MKKFLSFATFLLVAFVATAQQPTTNLYQNPSPVPIYTPLAYPTLNYPQTGAYVNYYYDTVANPATGHDTIRISFTGVAHEQKLIHVNANIILLFDTTGDTATNGNYPNGKATIWYKKAPFQATHNFDDINLVFINDSGSVGSKATKYKVTVPWFNLGLAGDTIHIGAKTTTALGGAFVKATYYHQKAKVVWTPYTTW